MSLYNCHRQLYNTRKKFLKPGKEETHWNDIDWQFMTEESSGEDGELVRHSLPWRSQGDDVHECNANLTIDVAFVCVLA